MTRRYWLAQLARAVVAFVVGCLISLDQSHSASVGIVYFSIFSIVGGLVVASYWFVTDASQRVLWLVQGLIGVAAGIVALVVKSGGLGALLYGASVWALLTGALELYLGWRGRRREASVASGSPGASGPAAGSGASAAPVTSGASLARDRLFVGGLTVVLAIVYLVIPADHRLVVGILGAYAVVIGVYLAIGAFSLKWAGAGAAAATESHA